MVAPGNIPPPGGRTCKRVWQVNREWMRINTRAHFKTKHQHYLPVEVVQLLKIGYATIYEDASPSRREGREVRAGRGSM